MINYFNESTRCTRYKHTEKMKEKIKNIKIFEQEKIYKGKDPMKIDT